MSDTTTPASPPLPALPTTPTPWTLCLQSSQGRSIIRLEQPGITTTADLYRLASTELLLCGDGNGNGNDNDNGKSHTSIASLKYGFPPKPLPQDDTVMITSILQNQERLQVVTTTTTTTNATSATSATKSKGKGKGKGKGRKGTTSLEASSLTPTPPGNPTDTTTADATADTTPTTTPATATATATATRKSKRAAAQRATENMPAIIQAQEEFMKSQQQQQQQQQRSSSSSPKKNSAKRPRRTATTTNPTSNPTPTTPASTTRTTTTTFAASVGQGRRLADGAAMAAPSNRSPRPRPRPRRGGAGSNTTGNNAKQQQPADMSEALLGALNDSGKMGQVLRKGMKNAVQASYETTRAFSRLAAIQSKSYTMTMTMTMTTVGGAITVADTTTSSTGRLKVQYRGSVDKTAMTTEEVDGIPREVLEAVIRGIHASNPEALRPENVALLSPRVLWSLVHHFPNCITVADMYQQLVPSSTPVSTSTSMSMSMSSTNTTALDWTFLRRRAPQLSEKALENIRQAQEDETNNSNTLDPTDEDQKASEAIAAVEHAMEHLQDYAATERQARQATAALQRLQHQEEEQSPSSSSASSKWKLVTPSEPDQDELRDCIVSEDNANDDATNPKILSSNDHRIMTSQWIQQLMRRCHIHNWRELANVEDAAALAKSLHLPIDQVQSWISRAQDQSVDEIIVEICDGNVQAVELLMERARSGTPKDLASWRRIPNLLHQRLQKEVNEALDEALDEAAPVNQKRDAPTSTTTNMTLQQVGTWTTRAHQVIQEYEWLNWYATPVE